MKITAKNIYLGIIILFYIWLFYSLFIFDISTITFSIYVCSFMLLKWVFDKRNCTLGYIECKLRNCKKEQGYINQFCSYYGDLIYEEYVDLLFLFTFVIIIFQFIKLIFVSKIKLCKKGSYPE
tara:strand:+ start:108 stop:476 length:369 start_codon:yes stop_codon:yes gene_type:complete